MNHRTTTTTQHPRTVCLLLPLHWALPCPPILDLITHPSLRSGFLYSAGLVSPFPLFVLLLPSFHVSHVLYHISLYPIKLQEPQHYHMITSNCTAQKFMCHTEKIIMNYNTLHCVTLTQHTHDIQI